MDKKQVILAVDTATEYCSVALQVHEQRFVREKLAPQKHAALILGMIDEVLTEAKLTRNDLELIGFGRGPGSFTGVRIACSVAQGLALGLERGVFGVDELKLLAVAALEQAQAPEDNTERWLIGSIDARMGEVYYALYHYIDHKLLQVIDTQVGAPEKAQSEIMAALPAGFDVSQVLVAGSGMAVLKEHGGWTGALPEQESVLYPRARTILDVYQYEDFEIWDAEQAEPLYCRNEVTWKKIGEQ